MYVPPYIRRPIGAVGRYRFVGSRRAGGPDRANVRTLPSSLPRARRCACRMGAPLLRLGGASPKHGRSPLIPILLTPVWTRAARGNSSRLYTRRAAACGMPAARQNARREIINRIEHPARQGLAGRELGETQPEGIPLPHTASSPHRFRNLQTRLIPVYL